MKNIVYELQNLRIVEKDGIYYPEEKVSTLLGLIDVFKRIDNNPEKPGTMVVSYRHFDNAKIFVDSYAAKKANEAKTVEKTIKPKM